LKTYICNIEANVKRFKVFQSSKNALFNIKKTIEGMSKQLQSDLKYFIITIRTKKKGRGRFDNNARNRLTSSQKKTRDWRDKKILEKIRQEQSQLKPSPGISKGSQRLLAQKTNCAPIYSNTRIHQINTQRRRNLEKIRKLAISPRDLNKTYYLERPKLISSTNISRAPSGSRTTREETKEETTEEKELRKKCTFMPRTDRKSREIFERRNANTKSVEDRLLTYRIVQEHLLNELIKENTPTFTPRINRTYRKNTHSNKMDLNRTTMTPRGSYMVNNNPKTNGEKSFIIDKLQQMVLEKDNSK